MQRLFVKAEDIVCGKVLITGDDAFHISRSLRMRVGDELSLSVDDGRILDCVLEGFTCDSVCASVVKESVCESEPPCKIHIFQALPKSDKLETVVQKAVECGAYSVTPFLSTNCIAKIGDSMEKKLLRLNKISAEAAKQCGRGIIPKVTAPLTYKQMLEAASKADLPLFCYEGEGTMPIGRYLKKGITDIAVIVGSEGGFTPEEAQMAKDFGLLPTGLGKRILRCETAPLFVLSCLSFFYELDI